MNPVRLAPFACFAAAALLLTGCPAPPQNQLAVEVVARGLQRPTFLTSPPGDASRLFVTEQFTGRVRIIDNGRVRVRPFLNIKDLLPSGARFPNVISEQGLFTIAFSPGYATNGEFYICYSAEDGATTVARYRVSADDPNLADPDSGEVILSVAQPTEIHNGGMIAFGPDGYLYVALGDGGGQNDENENGQDLSTLLGAILRIDVARGDPYAIPQDNPFVDTPGARPEIWAYGLRNPWRFSFDRETGDLWVGDVGQDHREEINRQPAESPGGENYGWKVAEGFACRGGYGDCGLDPAFATPIHDYQHIGAGSVTGGYVYRGSAIPWLQGQYLFADWTLGFAWSLEQQNGAITGFRDRTNELMPASGLLRFISSFGEDADGELYTLDTLSGRVFRIVAGP